MKRWAWSAMTALCCLPLSLYAAENKQWEAGLSGGTNGIGLELAYRFSDFLRLRGGYHFYDLDIDTDAEDNNGIKNDELKYSSELQLSNFGLLADWYPWGGVFRVSGGVVLNENDFNVDAVCENPSGCEVGGNSFSRTEIGTIRTDIDIQQIGPYLGVGWDTPLGAAERFVFSVEIGAFYQGSPDIEMTSDGTCVNSALIGAACRQALEDEENELEDELEDFVVYPVLSVGLAYRF